MSPRVTRTLAHRLAEKLTAPTGRTSLDAGDRPLRNVHRKINDFSEFRSAGETGSINAIGDAVALFAATPRFVSEFGFAVTSAKVGCHTTCGDYVSNISA